MHDLALDDKLSFIEAHHVAVSILLTLFLKAVDLEVLSLLAHLAKEVARVLALVHDHLAVCAAEVVTLRVGFRLLVGGTLLEGSSSLASSEVADGTTGLWLGVTVPLSESRLLLTEILPVRLIGVLLLMLRVVRLCPSTLVPAFATTTSTTTILLERTVVTVVVFLILIVAAVVVAIVALGLDFGRSPVAVRAALVTGLATTAPSRVTSTIGVIDLPVGVFFLSVVVLVMISVIVPRMTILKSATPSTTSSTISSSLGAL